MQLAPTTPVIVGVSQVQQKPEDLAEAVEAIELMAQACSAAATDAGDPGLLGAVDQIGVVQGAWGYADPGRLLAERFAPNHRPNTLLSGVGGQTPQAFVNLFANRIAKGEINAAVVVGAETIWSRRRQKRAGLTPPRSIQADAVPDERFGGDVSMSTEFESSRGLEMPIHYYPLFESAVRASRGEMLDEHRDRISQLWSTFNRVAVDNPHAWSRTAMTADEIRNPSASNRMVGFPYTKAMNSNWDLDQGAAIIICSYRTAKDGGLSPDRFIFPLAGAEANDTPAVSNRRDLHSSPAIEAAGRALFEIAGLGPDDIDHLDLYSCFPSAVQVAAASLRISEQRQLTMTGGLTFAGGPLNNYVSHSIATMVAALRASGGNATGLVTANGGYLTKHALGIYGTEPPVTPFAVANVQAEVDRVPTVPVDEAYHGPVRIEAATVMHSADGPEVGLCALRTPDQARTWGRCTEADAIAQLLEVEPVGRLGVLDSSGSLHVSR